MNAFAFYHNITCRSHRYERQLVTKQCRRGFHKRARLAVEGLSVVDVVCHLYQFHGFVLVAHHKIHFFAARRLLVVVYVQEVVATPSQQFYIDVSVSAMLVSMRQKKSLKFLFLSDIFLFPPIRQQVPILA